MVPLVIYSSGLMRDINMLIGFGARWHASLVSLLETAPFLSFEPLDAEGRVVFLVVFLLRVCCDTHFGLGESDHRFELDARLVGCVLAPLHVDEFPVRTDHGAFNIIACWPHDDGKPRLGV